MRDRAKAAGNRASRAVAALGLGALLLVGATSAIDALVVQQASERTEAVAELTNDIDLTQYYDEVLTMSARYAAASGDLSYIARYERAAREFDALLLEIEGHIEEFDGKADVAALIETSAPLLEAESRSFQLLRAGQREPALAVLTGQQYERDKQAFDRVLADTLRALSADRDRQLARTTELRDGVLIAGLLAMLVLAATWAIAQRAVRRWWSEREEARRELAEVSRRNALILDAAGEGIYALDRSGDVTLINPAALSLTEHSEDELLGKNAHQLLHHSRPDGSPMPAEECVIQRSLATGEPARNVPDLYWRRDGSSFPVELTVTPKVQSDSGEIVGAVVVFRDVSERRAVDRMKDEFISVVSHELRTPLTSIRGSLGLLASGSLGELSPPAARMLHIAESNTDRLVRLINDILDIERIESGAVRLELTRVSAQRLVTQAVEGLRGMAEEAGVSVVAQADEIEVRADPDRIVQTLTNLIGNAIKFSPRDSEVHVSARRQGAEAVFSVRDQGRGIPAENLERIFERFQQVDATDARQKGGSGLGLAISRSIVEQHDGRIWADSVPGRGSTFSFTLPALDKPRTPSGSGAGRAVLVADDDPEVLDEVSGILQRHGYQPLTASSGQEALRQVATAVPAAVVLDLVMPGTSGWDVLAELRAAPASAHLPVVILSVLRKDAAESSGFDGWVRKPVDENELLGALDRAFNSESVRSVIRVVLVEDDSDLSSVLAATLQRRGLRVHVAASVEAAHELVPRVHPDLIVADIRLGETGDGVELLTDLRQRGYLQGVPILVYTAVDLGPEQRARLAAMNALVLTKSRVSPEQFEARVLQLLGVDDASEARP